MKPERNSLKPERIQLTAGLHDQAPTIAKKVMAVVDWIIAVAEVLKELFWKPTDDDSSQ